MYIEGGKLDFRRTMQFCTHLSYCDSVGVGKIISQEVHSKTRPSKYYWSAFHCSPFILKKDTSALLSSSCPLCSCVQVIHSPLSSMFCSDELCCCSLCQEALLCPCCQIRPEIWLRARSLLLMRNQAEKLGCVSINPTITVLQL